MENEITINNTLISLIEAKKYSSVKDVLITMNSADIATLFEELPQEILPKIFRLLPKELAADTFVEMDTDLQQLLIKSFSDKELKAVVNELYADDAVDIVEEMPANVVKRILKQADPDMRKDINQLLKYPEDSAGSVMTTEFVDITENITVKKAIEHIHRTGIDKETVNTCYVTQNDKVLIGTVTLRTLILANPDDVISDLMDRNIISVTTDVDQETVASDFSKYNLLAMPVVDAENRLVGIVTVDDVLDVIEEEATEDIVKMAAISPSDKTYFKTGIFETVKNRIPWLMLLMISATFTGMIISTFEVKLTLFPALIAFIPMLMDTGGNSGSQSSVTVIRSLSLGDIEFKDIGRVIWKEIRVAVICGGILAAVNFVKVWLIDILALNSTASLKDDLIVCLTLMFTVIIAKLIGCTLPIIADKMGLDPAVMASPFITTIVDAISLLIYFGFASLILGV